MSQNCVASANRLHIGIFGKVNSGKSTLINACTGQDVSIVSKQAGTTTDAVSKAMEIPKIGPCVWIDTAGFSDDTALGGLRMKKTRQTAEKCDMAILLIAEGCNAEDLEMERAWYQYLQSKKVPVITVLNIFSLEEERAEQSERKQKSVDLCEAVYDFTKEMPICMNAKTKKGIDQLYEQLLRKLPQDYEMPSITGNLADAGDVVMLVMPQDAQAPKGRLILPQVQTIRELLDKECIVISVTPEQMQTALLKMMQPPKLIITDSQVFREVYEMKPKESLLTSFSVLFAAYKGDLKYYTEGAKVLDTLHADARVLIAECCTHAPLSEDIGRVKIPNMLRRRYGDQIEVEVVSGTDFPENLQKYDLVIQCGGCMFHRKYIMNRIERAKEQMVPMTNYGVAIAHLSGILDKICLQDY